MGRRPFVVVVGGGLAGLSAGIEAADSGASVLLLEKRHRLGGATWSFERHGVWFDNGQHVFMRCCTAYQTFLRRIGSAGNVRIQPRLNVPVLAPGGRVGSIRRTPGPSPIHLAPSLLAYPHLTFHQRFAVLKAGFALRRLDPDDPTLDDVSFGDWLAEHEQGETAIANFWNLIILPTVNVPADEASLKLAVKVFSTGLLSRAAAGDIGWAKVPLSVLHGDAARNALQSAGGEIRTRSEVSRVGLGGQGDLEVHADGQRLPADAVVVAVQHDAVASLLPPESIKSQDRLDQLGVSPIINIHLVYDRPVTDLKIAAGVDTEVQFLFDRTEGAGLDDGSQCLAISLSGAKSYMKHSSTDLIAHFAAELTKLLPAAAEANVIESMVTRERAATFFGGPDTHNLRADAASGIPGVYLAGAWTDTGWPATMEGAVLSGVKAGRFAARYASVGNA